MFFLEFLLTEILSFIIDAIVEQRRPSLDIRREFFTDVLRHKGNKIMNANAQFLDQLMTVIQGLVLLCEDLIGMAEPIESLDVEIRLYQIKIPHFLNDPQRNEIEDCFELEEEIGAGSLVVEVDKSKGDARSIFK